MIDWLILRMAVVTASGPVIGPGLIAREYAKRLLAREYDELLARGVLREWPEKACDG